MGSNDRSINAIYRRTSTRNFEKNYQIPADIQELILNAGLQAPSPKNRQPWFFVLVEQRQARQNVSEILRKKLDVLKEERRLRKADCADLEMAGWTASLLCDCSLLIFICYERDESNEHGEEILWELSARAFETLDLQAIGAAVQNMLLQATELEVDSLWIGDVLYAHDELHAYLNLKYPFVGAVAFGKRARNTRKDIGEKCLRFEAHDAGRHNNE